MFDHSDGLTLLGSGTTSYPTKPEDAVLERIPNRWTGSGGIVLLDCPEFTSLCPVTAQPDFGRLTIQYQPDQWLIESKALKLYLFSFRNEGMFMEFIVNKIATDLFALLTPHWLEVRGDFMPRGGIAIRPCTRLERPT